jgi:ribonuclease G
LRWRKRKQQEERAPLEAPAPQEEVQTTEAVAPEGATPPKPKRRRGSRGGRGRGKRAAEEKTETKAVAERAEPRAQTAKKPDRPERKQTRSTRASSRRRVPARRPPLPPAKRELLVSVDVGEQRVAVLEDDRVAEVYLERPEKRSIAGNIYLGTVDNVLPGMEAAFVEIGLEKNGFLYVDEIVVPELEGKPHGKKIQDLLQRGQTVLVQAVKDPMKTKGARLTTEISLAGRFVVLVPNGEGLGVSRRLDDDERARLKEIIKNLEVGKGGVIVRTAAEGASAEDIERDLVFLQRLWRTIETRAKKAKAPELIYQEAELPLRVSRDLFAGDFERALVDHDRTYKRIVGYLKKTSPHMAERVVRYKDKAPLFEAHGVDAEIRSTLSRRVDLPSGGYLVFDYAEAFTVIDVNTGRFVGSRSKSSGGRLEDTITKNNLEAVKEVVRQLRLRDIGGIIVIDFIDMANPKNRATVEEALRTELERDRTKTYVVEISPLGLVEMTRQNVTEGPREILTKKCPTCGGDGIVVSETTAAVDVERRLRALATGSRKQAYRVELNARVAAMLIGPGATRLAELEAQTKRRFFVVPKEDVHADHLLVLAEGKLEELKPAAPVEEGATLQLQLVELGLHDPTSAVGKADGYDVCVAGAAGLVGKKVKARIERALDGTAYATLVGRKVTEGPITAEAEAEKPTRKPPARKAAEAQAPAKAETPAEEPARQAAESIEQEPPEAVAEEKPKKKTRRGTRGGRGRKRKTTVAQAPDEAQPSAEGPEPETTPPEPLTLDEQWEQVVGALGADGEPTDRPRAPRIHTPEPALDEAYEAEPGASAESADGDQPEKPRKKTRRGTRGGRNRRKRKVAPATESSAEAEAGRE